MIMTRKRLGELRRLADLGGSESTIKNEELRALVVLAEHGLDAETHVCPSTHASWDDPPIGGFHS